MLMNKRRLGQQIAPFFCGGSGPGICIIRSLSPAPTWQSAMVCKWPTISGALHLCQHKAMVMQMPNSLPKCMFLDLPRDVIRSLAHFRLCAHTPWIVTVTHNTSPTCDLCNANSVQDEQHVLFHCTHPHVVFVGRTYASLFLSSCRLQQSFEPRKHCFPYSTGSKLCFFLHALIVFYEQASSRTSQLMDLLC